MSTKRCSKCGLVKLLADFHSNGPGKLRGACKECEAIRDSARRPAIPKPPPLSEEQRRERQRERDRARWSALAALRPPKPPKRPQRVKVGRFGPAPEVLTHTGLSMTRKQWAAYLGLAGDTSMTTRLRERLWPLERALSQDVAFMNQKAARRQDAPNRSAVLVYEGQRRTIEEWAERLRESHGMTAPALRGRLGLGWPVWRALGTKVRPHERKVPKAVSPDFVGPKRPVGRPRKRPELLA